MRRAIGDAVMSACGALAVVFALVMFDPRVRDQINTVFDPSHPKAAIASLGGQLAGIATVLAAAARDQSIEHAPLVIFTLAATVLVLFMLRT